MSCGISTRLILTASGFRRVVLPFNDAIAGPKMSSASITSAFVIGQLFKSLFSRILTNERVLGKPKMCWSRRAETAAE